MGYSTHNFLAVCMLTAMASCEAIDRVAVIATDTRSMGPYSFARADSCLLNQTKRGRLRTLS